MKKLIALFLILTMALSMAACGSAQEEPEVEDVPAVERQNDRQKRICVISIDRLKKNEEERIWHYTVQP